MEKIKCPKCKNIVLLNQHQMETLLSKGAVLTSCSKCGHFFDYKRLKPYKRSLKFIVFSLLRIGTYLRNGDMVLNHPDCHYVAAKHCVSKRVVIPNGPQGYVEYKIPQKIKTHEELGAYLDNRRDFNLK